MIWDDTGFLLSKNKYSENSLIAEVFTKVHGKISGIIFGGTSRKIKNYLSLLALDLRPKVWIVRLLLSRPCQRKLEITLTLLFLVKIKKKYTEDSLPGMVLTTLLKFFMGMIMFLSS